MAPFRCTYRLQLGPDLGFARRARARAVPRAISASRTSISRPRCRRARARRTATTSSTRRGSRRTLGGEDAFRALCEAAREAGLGVVLDIVPNHMAASDENPFWRDPLWRAQVLRPRLAHRRAPALLRRRRARGRADGGPGGVGDDAREGGRAGARGADRRPADRPPRRACESAPLPRAAARGGDRARLGREDPRAGRAAARLAGRGHDGLRVPERRRRALRRPGRRGAADARSTRSSPEIGARSPSTRARRSSSEARTTFADEAEQLAASCRSRLDLSRGARVFPRLPHLRRARCGPRRGADVDGRRGGGASSPSSRGSCCSRSAATTPSCIRFQQTTPPVHAKGVEDTAFYRWNRLRGAERGRRRSRAVLALGRRVPPGEPRAGGAVPLASCSRRRRTTRSAAADVRARLGVPRALTPDEWAERVRRWHDLTGGPGPRTRSTCLPDARRRLADRARAARAVPREGAPRGEGEHELDRAGSRSGRSARSAWATGLLEHEAFLGDFVPFAERVAARGARGLARPGPAQATCPGVPDIYGGDELEFLALVDPDNRRPVDWEALRGGARLAPSRRRSSS